MEKYIYDLLSLLGYFITGLVMQISGYGITTWQFWVIGLIMIGQKMLGNLKVN